MAFLRVRKSRKPFKEGKSKLQRCNGIAEPQADAGTARDNSSERILSNDENLKLVLAKSPIVPG